MAVMNGLDFRNGQNRPVASSAASQPEWLLMISLQPHLEPTCGPAMFKELMAIQSEIFSPD